MKPHKTIFKRTEKEKSRFVVNVSQTSYKDKKRWCVTAVSELAGFLTLKAICSKKPIILSYPILSQTGNTKKSFLSSAQYLFQSYMSVSSGMAGSLHELPLTRLSESSVFSSRRFKGPTFVSSILNTFLSYLIRTVENLIQRVSTNLWKYYHYELIHSSSYVLEHDK